MSDFSIIDHIAKIAANDPSITKFNKASLFVNMKQVAALAEALRKNTHVTFVDVSKAGIDSATGALFADVIRENSTITELDLGYNKIGGDAIVEIGKALAVNKTLTEVKIHRMEKDYGHAAEDELVKLWETNVTLQRLYATLHDRRANSTNTRAEVRNKEISCRIRAGKDWMDLDPARKEEYAAAQEAKRKAAKEAEAAANAPISEKVPSTGGPYTLKQLTCLKVYIPDDVDAGKRESYLTDDDFKEVFGQDKETFYKLPVWKQKKLKQSKNLH